MYNATVYNTQLENKTSQFSYKCYITAMRWFKIRWKSNFCM